MIRFFLEFCWTVIFLVGTLPILLVIWITGFFSKSAKSKMSRAMIVFAFKTILIISGTKTEFIGFDRIPQDQAVLYCPNHRSLFDIIISYTKFPGPTGFVAKKETKKVPIFNIWMNFIHCKFLDRGNIRQGLTVIKESIEQVKSGISMCIFPEGTRNKTEDILIPFHDGSFKIAEKSGCPIIPVAIVNSNAIFENQFPKIKRAKVIIEFCEPIYTKDMTNEQKKTISPRVQECIAEAYTRNLEKLK